MIYKLTRTNVGQSNPVRLKESTHGGARIYLFIIFLEGE